jgi:hypothetical protein
MKAENFERLNDSLSKSQSDITNHPQNCSLDNFLNFFKKTLPFNKSCSSFESLSRQASKKTKPHARKRVKRRPGLQVVKHVTKKIEYVDLVEYEENPSSMTSFSYAKKSTAREENYYDEINLISPESEKEPVYEREKQLNWSSLIYNLEEEKNYIEPSNPYKTKEFTIHSSNPPSTAELIWSNEVDSESLPDWKVNIF